MIEKQFVNVIIEAAEANEVEPQDVTRDQFRAENDGRVSEKEIQRMGGFAAVRANLFPPDKDLAYVHGSRLVRNHRNKLEKQYGETAYMQKEFLSELNAILKANPPKMLPAVKPAVKSAKKIKRTLTICISDTHFGSNIDGEEMGGINHYSWQVASRRLAYLVQQAADYKRQYRAETELVVQLNGDIVAGVIHNQEWAVDLLTDQFVGSLHILGQALSYLATQFPSVRVVCSPGNHGRLTSKADKGRATTTKYDSHESMLYHALSMAVGNMHKNVEFLIPKTPYVVYKAGGEHLILVTHSDTVVHFGNPGSSIGVKSMREQINNLNSSEIVPRGKKLAAVCVGHSHSSVVHITDEGTALIMNGCLSGLDTFAQSLGIFGNTPSQTMFESTEAHALGDVRIIQLKQADKQTNLDKIIIPYIRLVDGK